MIEKRVEREVNLEFNQWQQDKCWMVGRCMYVCVYLKKVLPDAVGWRCNGEGNEIEEIEEKKMAFKLL